MHDETIETIRKAVDTLVREIDPYLTDEAVRFERKTELLTKAYEQAGSYDHPSDAIATRLCIAEILEDEDGVAAAEQESREYHGNMRVAAGRICVEDLIHGKEVRMIQSGYHGVYIYYSLDPDTETPDFYAHGGYVNVYRADN